MTVGTDRNIIVTLGLAAAILAVAGPAGAEEGTPPPQAGEAEAEPAPEAGELLLGDAVEEPADERLAREHFQQGLRLVAEEAWEPALAEFEESMRLVPSASASLDRALCLQRLRRYGEALRAFQAHLARYGGEASAEVRRGIAAAVEEIRSLTTEIPVEVDRDGARVVVDGEVAGTSPLAEPLVLQSGEHEIEVELEGFLRETRTVMVVHGRTEPVRIRLRPRPRTGMIRVLSETPGATVSIDGHDAGPAPFSGRLSEGPHHLLVTAPGHGAREVDVDVEADGDQLESITLHRRVHRAWFYSVAALAGAGLLTFAGLGSAALAGSAQYDPMALDARAARDDGLALVTAADVALGVTCGLAAVATVLAFFADWEPAADAGQGDR